jgi:hypothetical protein
MPLCTKRNLILIFNFLLFLSGAAAGVGGVQENEYGKSPAAITVTAIIGTP